MHDVLRIDMNIELNIDDLVLHGFAYGDRYLISTVIERELSRLFSERGAPPLLRRDGSFSRFDGGVFEAAPGANAEIIGIQVAQKIYGGLNQ